MKRRLVWYGISGLGAAAVACVSALGPIDELPRSLSIAEQQLVGATNEFAFNLFGALDAEQDEGNLFVSPLSISMALGMTYNGADGTTASQMADVLGIGGMSRDDANRAYRDLIDLLFDLDRRVEFRLANSIWARQGTQFADAFLQLNQQYFDATVSSLDFLSPDASRTINDWVKEQTEGRITEIVPDRLDDYVMFLINALYFKADWTTQFDKSRTRDEPFTLVDGTTTDVPMMYHGASTSFRTAYADGVSVVELPYGGDAFVMTLVLPNPGTSVHEVIADLDDARWSAWIDMLEEHHIEVVLPKFTIEYEVELRDVLETLGMTDAFIPDVADLTRMRPEGDLYIDHVKHKTFVEVDEEGTEAAAVTSVGIMPTSATPILRFDRPFMLAIRERFSGTVLFIGKIVNPTE